MIALFVSNYRQIIVEFRIELVVWNSVRGSCRPSNQCLTQLVTYVFVFTPKPTARLLLALKTKLLANQELIQT